MKHTKEPWEAKADPSYYGIVSEIYAMDKFIAATGGVYSPDELEANTKRIVACVNACIDIDNKKLHIGYVKELEAEIERLINLVMMQNRTIKKLSEQHDDVITGTEIPVAEDRRDTGTSTPITHCPFCGRRLEDI